MNLSEHIVGLSKMLRREEAAGTAPVLPGAPVLGHLRAFRRNAFAVLSEAAPLGDVVRIPVFHRSVWLVQDPAALPPLFDEQDTWLRGEALQPLIGRNVLTTNGRTWRRSRDLAQPSFHPRMTDRAAADFARAAAPALDGLGARQAGGVLDIARTLVEVFAQAATGPFGLQVRPAEAAAMPDALLRLQMWAFARLAGGNPETRAVRADMALLDGIIERSLDTPAPAGAPPSYLERLRQDRDVPRERLRDHLMLVLIASSDNPPNGLAFVLWALAGAPDWQKAARAEVDRVLGGAHPTPADLDRLPLLERIVDEGLRLFPPVWMLARNAVRDTELGGHPVPAGALALPAPWFVHRHPNHWQDPERFDPDRFLPARAAGRHRLAYLPFGAGPRRCIGTRLALQQMRLTLAMLLQRFTVARGGQALRLRGNFALRAIGGVPMRLQAR